MNQDKKRRLHTQSQVCYKPNNCKLSCFRGFTSNNSCNWFFCIYDLFRPVTLKVENIHGCSWDWKLLWCRKEILFRWQTWKTCFKEAPRWNIRNHPPLKLEWGLSLYPGLIYPGYSRIYPSVAEFLEQKMWFVNKPKRQSDWVTSQGG